MTAALSTGWADVEAPLRPLWRLFAGLDIHPVELVEVEA